MSFDVIRRRSECFMNALPTARTTVWCSTPLKDAFMSDQASKHLIGLLTRLQYPRPIPASLLKSSNVESIYGIFCWLVQILDPAIPVQTKAGSDDDRLNLLNGIVSELSTRFDICIDMTHFIPAAGDRAVKELIKVGSIIEKALYFAEELSSSSEGDVQVDNTIEATRRASALVDEITEICSRLSNHLEKECDDSKDRTNALHFINSVLENNPSARDHCNLILSRKLDMSNSAIERLDRQCKILISNQRGTEEKIQKKSIDLERSSKRLESVKTVRPAYMDEYEKLEKDLEVEYERYVLRLRNKDYLAGELSSFNQAATEVRNKLERSMKRMQEKFREDELRVLKGCSESDNTPIASESSGPVHPEDADQLVREGSSEYGACAPLSLGVTPRDRIFSTNSDKTPSEPSGEDDDSLKSSEVNGSISDDDGDSDSNF